MIHNIIVTNPQGEELVLDLDRPWDSGLLVVNGEGLGPPKATINVTELAGVDGSQYNSAVLDARNIVLTLAYLEHPTIEHSRHRVYKYFPVKGQVKLTFETDLRTTHIYGRVESNEALIFSEQTGSTISIICPDPLLRGSNELEISFKEETDEFMFPFSDPTTSATLIMSTLSTKSEVNFYYEGTQPVGFVARFSPLTGGSAPSLIDTLTGEHFRLDSTRMPDGFGWWQAGDIFEVSSVRGNKYARLYRGSQTINIIRAMIGPGNPGMIPDWLTIKPGENVFHSQDYYPGDQIQIFANEVYEGV